MAVPVAAAMLLAACTADRLALTFSPERLADGTVGQPYEQLITVGGNVTPVFLYSIQNGLLPAGLKIEPVPGADHQGRIVGTPTIAGTSTFEVVASCYGTNVSGQTGTRGYTLTIR